MPLDLFSEPAAAPSAPAAMPGIDTAPQTLDLFSDAGERKPLDLFGEEAPTVPLKETPRHQKEISLGMSPEQTAAWDKGVKKVEESTERMLRGIINPEAPFGAMEAAAHLGTMVYGVPVMGFGHIADLATGGKYKIAEKIGNRLIYEPQTESGQVIRDILFSPATLASEVGEVRADTLFDELIEEHGPEDIRTSLYPTIRKTFWDILGIFATGKALHRPGMPKPGAPAEMPKLDPTFAKEQQLRRMAVEKTRGVQRPLETLAKKEAGLKGEIPIEGKLAKREIPRAELEAEYLDLFKDVPAEAEGARRIVPVLPRGEVAPDAAAAKKLAGETGAIYEAWAPKGYVPRGYSFTLTEKVDPIFKDSSTTVSVRNLKDLPSKIKEKVLEYKEKVGEHRAWTDTIKDINTALGEKGELSLKGKDFTPEQQAAITRLSGDIDVIRRNATRVEKSVEQYLTDLKVDPRVASLLARKAEDLKKYARSINLKKQDIPEQYKQFETDIALTKPKKAQTWDRTGKLSAELRADYKKSAKTLEKAKQGEALTAVEIDAVRQINVNAISRLKEMATELPPEQFKGAFETYKADVFEATSKASSEAGRALNIHKRTVSINRMADAFAKLKRSLNERELKEFKELNTENPLEIKRFMDRLGDPAVKDYFIEYWYNSILSGPPTHLVNTISNTGWLAFQVPHRALVSGIDKLYSKVTGKERVRYLNEIVPMLAGYKTGFVRGAKGAVQMMKTGKLVDFETKWAQEMGYSIGAFERSPYKILRKAAPYITPPTRALRAMDVWANSIAYDAQARSLARQASNKLGLKGKKRTEFERNFIEHLSDEAHESSMKQAKYSTFMNDPDPFTKWIIGARKIPVIGPASQFVVPFINTISNLTKRGMEMTPGLGIVKEAVSRGMGRGQSTPEVMAKQIEGSVLALYAFYKVGLGEITGPLPKNKSERDAFYRQGKKPWAVRIGDTWYQYRRVEPFNTVIASVATAYNEIKNAKDEDTKTQIFLKTVHGIKENLIDSSYFQGIQQIFDKHGRAKGAGQRWTASWVPYSSFWRSVNRGYEAAIEDGAKLREGNDWLKAFSQTIPGLSGRMPARLNIWGEEIELPGGVFRQWLPYKWSKETTDMVEKELARLEIYPGVPRQTVMVRGEPVKLDDDMYRDYLLDFGRGAKELLKNAIRSPSYTARSDEQKIKILTKRLHRARNYTLVMLKRQLREKRSDVANPATIDRAARQAAPSPTEAQIKAGNYKKGHVKLHGFDISIENPRGSTRSGTDVAGKEWSVTMQDHYGYIKETVGKDKEHLDVFIGKDPESDIVFVVDQVDPRTGKFDEHKVLMGYNTIEEAKAGYLANYEEGWQGIGNITQMSLSDFKAWTKSGNTTKAIGK